MFVEDVRWGIADCLNLSVQPDENTRTTRFFPSQFAPLLNDSEKLDQELEPPHGPDGGLDLLAEDGLLLGLGEP